MSHTNFGVLFTNDRKVYYKVTSFLVQKAFNRIIILGFIIQLDLTEHSLRAKSGLSAEMGAKPQ